MRASFEQSYEHFLTVIGEPLAKVVICLSKT